MTDLQGPCAGAGNGLSDVTLLTISALFVAFLLSQPTAIEYHPSLSTTEPSALCSCLKIRIKINNAQEANGTLPRPSATIKVHL